MPDLPMPERPTSEELRDPDHWPFRHVTVFCDRCGDERSADVRADTAQQGFGVLRELLVAQHSWLCTERGDWCPACAGSTSARPEQPRVETVEQSVQAWAGNYLGHRIVDGAHVTRAHPELSRD